MTILENRKILVCGVLNKYSIAYAIAQAVVAHGGELALTYQTSDRLRDKVGKLAKQDFGDCLLLPLDVAEDEQCAQLFTDLDKEWGTLDGIVHSIAFAPRETLTGDYHCVTTRRDFATALDISTYSFTALAQQAAPLLSDSASLLTLTYLGAERAIPNYNVMGVAKAALEASVRYLAAGLGPAGVRVNAISAGPIKTLASSGIAGMGKMLKAFATQAALGRNISQEEVGKVAAFLLSEMASGITGEVIHVDAGYSIMGGKPMAPESD